LLVALDDSLLVGIVHLQLLLQHRQQFRTPSALQTLGNLLLAGLTSRITIFSQLSRIAFSRYVARMIVCPVSPLISLITFANCRFICVSAFWIR